MSAVLSLWWQNKWFNTIPKPAIGHDPEPVTSTSNPYILFPYDLNHSLVAKLDGSTLLIPKPVTGHDSEPVPSTFNFHKLSP